MTVLLLTEDLMTVSRVAGVAAQLGAKLDTATNAEQAASACSELSAEVLIVDLSTPSLDVATLLAAVKPTPGTRPRVVAFGPHVHEERLAAAREAGCNEVVSRGQFFSQTEMILERLLRV